MESYVRITCDNKQYGIEIGDVCQLVKVDGYADDYKVYHKGVYLYTTPGSYIGDVWEKAKSEDDKFRELLLNA